MQRDAEFIQTTWVYMQGFSLHAAVRGAADDRQALEQLCRYVTRPALANVCEQCNAAGQGVLKLESRSRDVTTHLATSALEFVLRLTALWCHVRTAAGDLKGVTVERQLWGTQSRDPQYRNGSSRATQFFDQAAGSQHRNQAAGQPPFGYSKSRP